MPTEMTCPFNDGRWCKQKLCMLWISDLEDCAITVIAKNLRKHE